MDFDAKTLNKIVNKTLAPKKGNHDKINNVNMILPVALVNGSPFHKEDFFLITIDE